ncbi:hypothetical protein PPACK8108_LOCUS4347 [Phakopsora pachyrhizi]|uniref:Uncharacterized protein n=1 Tax=Phakopsora pachyrhizi TaxID=170000 RepID=A0AAV0ANM7_PHAPC|nr:hypothetical protein PPACK8108_LOCUS4347 [Phakopsora pachyrhizi]
MNQKFEGESVDLISQISNQNSETTSVTLKGKKYLSELNDDKNLSIHQTIDSYHRFFNSSLSQSSLSSPTTTLTLITLENSQTQISSTLNNFKPSSSLPQTISTNLTPDPSTLINRLNPTSSSKPFRSMNLFRPATPPRPRTWDDENGFETFEVEDLNLDLEVTITCDNQPTGSSSSSENEINYQNPGVRRAARDSVHSSRAHQLRSNQSSHLHRSHQTISLGHVQQVMNDLEASELLYNSNRNRKRLRYSIDGEGNPSFAESVTSQEDFSDDDRVLDPGISHPNQKQLRSSSSRLVYDGTNQLYQIKTPSDQSLTRQSPLSRMSPSDTLTGPRIRFNRQTTRIVHQSDKDPSSSDSYCHPPVIGPDDSEDQGQDVLVEKIRPTDQNSTSPNVNDENDPNCHSTMITSEAGPSNPRAARSIVKDLKSITHQENCETRSRDDLESENDDDDDDDDDDAKLNRESDSEDERENKRSGDNDFDKGAVVDGSDERLRNSRRQILMLRSQKLGMRKMKIWRGLRVWRKNKRQIIMLMG